jgi:hypothetical protein
MNPTIGISIVISAITLVGMVGTPVNYSPAPAHAVKDTCKFVAPDHACFSNRHDCEQYANSVGAGTCAKH